MTATSPVKLSALNASGKAGFVAVLGPVFEHSPWVAEAAMARRPFASVDELHAAMMHVVRHAALDRQLALVRAHPELAGHEAKAGSLTPESTGEQGRLGFTSLSRAELERMADINRRYREKFGFPCIVALRLHATRASVLADMERRTGSETLAELAAALDQIGHITRGRLAAIFGENR
jgi:OHCU decarboxylase